MTCLPGRVGRTVQEITCFIARPRELKGFTPKTKSIDVKAECNARPAEHINHKVKRGIQIVYIKIVTSVLNPVVETILILPRCWSLKRGNPVFKILQLFRISYGGRCRALSPSFLDKIDVVRNRPEVY